MPALGPAAAGRLTEAARDLRLAPIPEAEDEVRALRRLYGAANSTVYLGAQATEEALKAGIASPDVVHVAAHAILDDRRPIFSNILLSPSGEDDGVLEAWEVRDLRLRADLVVLSACHTGRGRITPGEGVVGLAWAFFAAGARTLVVSQWAVESSSTARLMVEFHRRLARPGTSKPEALRQAALSLLARPRTRHPRYWAPFVAVGASD
jgi:CHAT domain-containing protein